MGKVRSPHRRQGEAGRRAPDGQAGRLEFLATRWGPRSSGRPLQRGRHLHRARLHQSRSSTPTGRSSQCSQMWWDQGGGRVAAQSRTRPDASAAAKCTGGPSTASLRCKLPTAAACWATATAGAQRGPWGGERDCLTYMGVDPYTKGGVVGDTYSGMLVENITSHGPQPDGGRNAPTATTGIYDVILSVHDNSSPECNETKGSVDFGRPWRTCPTGPRLPVAAEGWSGYRYKK